MSSTIPHDIEPLPHSDTLEASLGQLSLSEDRKLTEDEIRMALSDAMDRKAQGNESFRLSHWNEALGYYESALARLPVGPEPPTKKGKGKQIEPDLNIEEDEESNDIEPQIQLSPMEKECATARSVLNCNISACYMKLGQHQQVVEACTKALVDDPQYIKALHRRASSNVTLSTWSSLTSAKKDYETLSNILPPNSPLLPSIRKDLQFLQPRIDAAMKKETDEMMGKLKDVGNSLLGLVGLSTDNFKFEPNGQGGYSMNFRRVPQSQTLLPSGTRPCSTTPSVLQLSTGIPSLDDILGGGLPLGSVLVILTPDPHSAWGELLQRYFISQGLANGQSVCVVAEDASELLEGSMWLTNRSGDNQDEKESETNDKITIAWRYESMKQFQTTVPSSHSPGDDFCHNFDLTSRIPSTVLSVAAKNGQLSTIDPSSLGDSNVFQVAASKVGQIIREGGSQPAESLRQRALRLCLPNLGGPPWGDFKPIDVLRFLHSLRGVVRGSTTSVFVTLPSFLSTPGYSEGWVQKLGFLSDGCLTFASFGADPALSATFPNYSGLLQVHKVPSLQTLLAPSLRHSHLLGLSSSPSHAQSVGGGGGENNLAFRCMRKRFVIETLHLDVDGGVGERRTAPPVALASVEPADRKEHSGMQEPRARVEIGEQSELVPKVPPAKAKKKVVFRSDQPSIYDF